MSSNDPPFFGPLADNYRVLAHKGKGIMLFIFKFVLLVFFMIFISFVVQLLMTIFKIRRRVNEYKNGAQNSQNSNYSNQPQSNKKDIDAEYRVINRDK